MGSGTPGAIAYHTILYHTIPIHTIAYQWHSGSHASILKPLLAEAVFPALSQLFTNNPTIGTNQQTRTNQQEPINNLITTFHQQPYTWSELVILSQLKDGLCNIVRPWGVTVLAWVCRDGYRGLQAPAISHRSGLQMAIVLVHNTCYHFIALVGEGRSPRNPGTGPLKTRTLAPDHDHDSLQTLIFDGKPHC